LNINLRRFRPVGVPTIVLIVIIIHGQLGYGTYTLQVIEVTY